MSTRGTLHYWSCGRFGIHHYEDCMDMHSYVELFTPLFDVIFRVKSRGFMGRHIDPYYPRLRVE